MPAPQNDIPDQTVKIDAKDYGAQHNPDRIAGTRYAILGLLYFIRREQSAHVLLLASGIALLLAFYVQLELEQFVLLLLGMGLVWTTEMLNTAIEAVVDLASPEMHPLAKVSKDVAAGATFVASSVAGVLALLLLLPPLLEKTGG